MAAVATTATAWRDPDHTPRAEAVHETLQAANAFTEEAISFAVNQQMALLTGEALHAWAPPHPVEAASTVGVLHPGNVPMVELQDALAVVLTGHRYLGCVSSKSPALLPAFLHDLRSRTPALGAETASADRVFAEADALIATGTDETLDLIRAQCRDEGLPASRCLLRGSSWSVGVLDGREDAGAYERFAEDILLHEGFGCRNVAIVWAPRDLSPDGLLEALVRFRSVFPPHEGTPGRLMMQQAFLKAVDAPYACGKGLGFLVSRGEPEAQPPGHVRWTEYDDIGEVGAWLHTRQEHVQLVVSARRLQASLAGPWPVLRPGQAHRPGLGWRPDGIDTIAFLTGLASRPV